MKKFAKLFGSALGGLAGAGTALAIAFGAEMTPEQTEAVGQAATLLGAMIGTYFAPANAT